MVCSEVVINVSLCDNSECELGLNPAFVTRNLQISSVVMSGFVMVVEQVLHSLRFFDHICVMVLGVLMAIVCYIACNLHNIYLFLQE